MAQARMEGEKSSEINVVRDFIKETGLEKLRLTLDAQHCNPETTAQIEQAGGNYITQVKDSQPILLAQCKELSKKTSMMSAENTTVTPGHGRIVKRHARLFPMTSLSLDQRWQKSGLNTLVVMRRETFDTSKQKTTTEESYYISNVEARSTEAGKGLVDAVRKHWGVESNNWILDVTFDEDAL